MLFVFICDFMYFFFEDYDSMSCLLRAKITIFFYQSHVLYIIILINTHDRPTFHFIEALLFS